MSALKFKSIVIFNMLFMCVISSAQQKDIKWRNPVDGHSDAIGGRAWNKVDTENAYDRLPLKAKITVRKPVWDLSRQSAGLNIRFKTNAKNIKIRYAVAGQLSMPHMPTTGVSGVDLYAQDKNRNWLWAKGGYSFGDTIRWNYSNLDLQNSDSQPELEYTLYLPLYNSVKWLEIGVDVSDAFLFIAPETTKPIVVYGTSIAQGACASRPGMAWTSIVERTLNTPLINLGFSGNGTLDTEMIELISEIDAGLYVFDCLPNLSVENWTLKDQEKVIDKIMNAVEQIRVTRPQTPILLTEHAGYTDEGFSKKREQESVTVNKALQIAFKRLKSQGKKDIYLLSKKEIALDMNSSVDGIHPSDLGMRQLAVAYVTKIRKILK